MKNQPKHGIDFYGNNPESTVLDQVEKYHSNNPFIGEAYTTTQCLMTSEDIKLEVQKILAFLDRHANDKLVFGYSLKEVLK